ncbi:unnamed protein product, partial [Vitis vinifera]
MPIWFVGIQLRGRHYAHLYITDCGERPFRWELNYTNKLNLSILSWLPIKLQDKLHQPPWALTKAE